MKTLLFSSHDIARIVQSVGLDRLMDDAINGISSACRTFDDTSYSVPVRGGFSYNDEHKGLLEWMPVIEFRNQVMMKLVAYHPRNPQQQNIPTVLSTAVTFDTSNGHTTKIVDATFLTSLRTGAASAVASSILAPPESRILGLVGAGTQAVTQLHGLSRIFEFEKILVNDVDAKSSDSFADRALFAGITTPVEVASLEHIVKTSDILCTATSIDVGMGPLFNDLELKPAVHINAVGSDFPGKTELPLPLLRRGLVCPDFREQAIQEGECQQLSATEIGPDLVTLLKDRDTYKSYRKKTTIFDSTGWAMEDFVCLDILTRLGVEVGCGTYIELECVADDPKNPYGFIEKFQLGSDRLLANALRHA